jgi:hypothetical protein
MDQTLHLHEFFVEGNNPEESHVLLNITEPSTQAEKSKGYFFVICEINNGDTKYIAKMQAIVDEIENSYYEIPDQHNQSALEIILNKINQENMGMIQEDVSLHCIIGAIRENDIIFSFYGHPQMVLFYKTKDGLFKKMDLVEENKTTEQIEHNQLFSQIVQGKIGQNDFFFAGTPNIVSYFNHDRLQKIITTRPPRQSSEHLQRVLSELKNNLSFGGIIINLQQASEAALTTKISPIKKGGSARSLKNLFSTEKNTASILSPSFLPKFQDTINEALGDQEEPEMMNANPTGLRANTEITSSHLRARQDRVKKPTGPNYQEMIKTTAIFIWKCLKFIVRILLSILIFIGTIFSTVGRNIMLLFFVLINYKNRRHNILLEWKTWWHHLRENLKMLPLITKILLSASIILVLLFGSGIVYVKGKQKNAALAASYAQTEKTIKNKEDEAESSLIYGDTDAALAQLQEAAEIIKTLPCASAAEKTNCQNLQQQLSTLQMKARKITLVTPQLLADWNSLAQTETVNDIFLLNNKIYGFGQNNSNILTYDALTKESALLTPGLSIKNFIAASVPKENDYAVLLYDNQNIVQFQPQDNSWKKIDIGYPNQNANISSLFVYNRRLYTLDVGNSKIYRHDSIKSGFSIGKEWTQNNTTDLKSGTDMSIDGDVFVLGQNGTISKFTKGQIQNFTTSKIDPPLTSADKIWTYNDLNYIYILDSAGKRIIILDKTGQIKNQITASEFVQPTGMIVDEAKHAAYVLDSNKLYQISLQ